MDYALIKHVHMSCAGLSGAFFMLRGGWMLRDSSMLHARFVQIAPHVIDTLLLASALTLAVISGQYPFVQSWITAKLLALMLYIVLGTIALKRGKTKTVRVTAFIFALLTFAYIGAVAFTKQPIPFA